MLLLLLMLGVLGQVKNSGRCHQNVNVREARLFSLFSLAAAVPAAVLVLLIPQWQELLLPVQMLLLLAWISGYFFKLLLVFRLQLLHALCFLLHYAPES